MLNLFSRAYTVQSRSFIPRDYLKRYAHKCSSKSKGPPWKILFFGTDPFSLHSLKSLCAKFRTGTLISSLGVVAKKHSAVSKLCAEEKLPLYFWPVNEEEIQSLYDIGMVVSFGNLIPRSTIEALPLGCINVHASLLPRWRGAAPIIHAVMAGDTETGVTIMRIHPDKFDVGEIVRQYRVSIGAHERAIELEKRLSIIGSDLLMECLRDLPKCVQMAVPQPKEGISYAPKVVPSVANVNLKSTSAQSLYNRHRAISHLFNLKVKWHGQVVKLKSISLDTHNKGSYVQHCVDSADSQKSALNFLLGPSKEENESKNVAAFDSEAGSCYYDKASKSLKVICSDGQALVVNTLQIGNKIMSARDFYNGYMSKCEKDKWKFTDIDSTTM